MTRARDYNRREFVSLLRNNGYRLNRQRGSHAVFHNGNGDSISINMEPNRMVMRRLIKEHGLKEEV